MVFDSRTLGSSLATVRQYLNRARYGLTGGESRLMNEEWDNLILLDACRYDQFEQLHPFAAPLEARISPGSTTQEFLKSNFVDETHHDTVYVTANPMYRTVDMEGTFHAVVDVWESEWHEQLRTVPPDPMATAVLEAHERFPNKRIFAHFMQPHYPFIGETGRQISHAGYEWSYRLVTRGEGSREDPSVWDLLESGDIDLEVVRRAYDENLELVFPHVERVLDAFDERTVITSDHGNLVGEKIAPFDAPRYGHPRELYVDELRKVPWLVVEGDESKRVESEPPGKTASADTEKIAERLSDLGYLDR